MIDPGRRIVPKKLATVIDRIHRLLERIESGDYPERAQLEETLTDGYAWALSLDGECARLERRISEQAAELSGDPGDEHARELSSLARLLTRRRHQLTELRTLLAALKVGGQEARVA
jgi:hypothetical protein